MLNLNFHDIEILLCIENRRSFAKAADELFLSPSALSHRVKKIEVSLGCTIFNRGLNQATLITEEGMQILSVIKKIRQLENELQHFLEENVTTLSSLSIGVFPYFALSPYSAFLTNFHRTFPELRISIHEKLSSQIIKDTLQGLEHLGIVSAMDYYPITGEKKLESLPLFTDELVFVPASYGVLDRRIQELGYQKGDVVPPSIINGEILALPQSNSTIYRRIQNIIEIYHLEPKYVISGSKMADLVLMAESGIASTFIYRNLFNIDTKPLQYYRLKGNVAEVHYNMVFDPSRLSSSIYEPFLRIAREFLTETPYLT